MKRLLLALPALFACSCATVVRGTSETAKFESTPTGAAVAAESVSADKQGPFNCVTPCQLELKRKRTWKVDFTLDGYKPVSGLLKPQVTGGGVAAGAGNVLIGGLIGVGIDAGTGANLDLRPNPMIAELEPVDSPEMSRILNAEIVTEDAVEETGEAEEAPAAEAPLEPAAQEVPAETGEPEAPAAEPAVEDADVEDSDGAAPIASAKNVNFDAESTDTPLVEVSATASDVPDHAKPNFYKPGEYAPTDEEADDLNRIQLEKALPSGN